MVIRPRGVLVFSDRMPLTTSFTPRPRLSSLVGSRSTRISRFWPPTMSTLPTPATLSKRFLIFFSTRTVSSRGERLSERTAREATGAALKSSFWMIGSSIPSGRLPRMEPILARTSWAASFTFCSS